MDWGNLEDEDEDEDEDEGEGEEVHGFHCEVTCATRMIFLRVRKGRGVELGGNGI